MAFRQKGQTYSNKFKKTPKETVVYTPLNLSYFIYSKLKDFFPVSSIIVDPCAGGGSLLKPWKEKGYQTYRIDINPESKANETTDFLKITNWDNRPKPDLIICNPPFNGLFPRMAPEVWLDKLVELFGKEQPLVLFTTYQMRICHSVKSKRYQKWLKNWPTISSILCLPDDIFKPYSINSEVIFFNLGKLKPHYFLAEITLPTYDPFE